MAGDVGGGRRKYLYPTVIASLHQMKKARRQPGQGLRPKGSSRSIISEGSDRVHQNPSYEVPPCPPFRREDVQGWQREMDKWQAEMNGLARDGEWVRWY